MSDEQDSEDAPSSEIGAPTPDFEFGVSQRGERVLFKFSHLIQWYDVDPETAIAYAEAIITAATAAAKERAEAKAIVPVTKKLILPGLPH